MHLDKYLFYALWAP